MTIYIKDTNETRTIELKVWDNNDNNGWSPDCFGDLAADLYRAYPVGDIDTEADVAMTDAEYRDTVAWWEREVDSYNRRESGNWFVENLSEDEAAQEYARNLEYGLFADSRTDEEGTTMKTNSFNRYSYADLAAAAKAPNAQQIDLDTLGAWFEQYGVQYWNGEYYDVDGDRLFPIFEADDDGDFQIVGYELK